MASESVQISQVIKKNFQTHTRRCFLQQDREGREKEPAGNSWDKAQERIEHANANLRCLIATLCCDFKGDKVCQSTVFFPN